MACEVCEHCNTAVHEEEAIIREGYSYHSQCHKCYVCGETNLRNADVFKGVIFCSGCSNRIFQGCSTARRVKTRNSKKQSLKRRNDKRFKIKDNRILEMARLTSVMNSQSPSEKSADLKTSTPPSVAATPVTSTCKMTSDLKKNSVEMGTTTTVTQELLKRIHSPINIDNKVLTPVKPRKRRKNKREKEFKNIYCSDLRIAELGVSTEIAHMALRRPSEVPVIIKSESGLKRRRTRSLTNETQESDNSGDGCIKHLNYCSSYSSQDSTKSSNWMNRTIGSIIKLPYKTFKRNILERSSLVKVIVNSRESECILRRFKTLFKHEITEHRRRGMENLFSTLNHKKTPYKLGWFDVMNQIPEHERCRHFRDSHSYRCMRTQAMTLAGPTRSELAVLRKKLKKVVCFNLFKNLHNFNKQLAIILTSEVYAQKGLVPARPVYDESQKTLQMQ